MERPWQIANEVEWVRECKEIIHVSRSILDQSMGVIEGARLLAALRFRVRAENDDDFLVFTGIASQTDDFPIGEVRNHWNADALARYDIDRQRAETDFRESAETACRNLIRKYDDAA